MNTLSKTILILNLFTFNILNVFAFSANSFKSSLKSLQLTQNQQIYYDYLQDDNTPIVICSGKAGTGKNNRLFL
jgi:predicted ribonuclease YlaK